MMFDRHANLKYQYGNRHFWEEVYYVSTVGLNNQTAAKYIREQETYDIAMDKLNVKEYKDPFEEKEIKKEKKKIVTFTKQKEISVCSDKKKIY